MAIPYGFSLGKIILKEDYIITNNRVSLPFSITEDPKDIKDVRLNFRTRCVTEENLTAYIGKEKVAEDKFCKGFVTDVTGPGEVYIQTKNVKEFVDWIWRYIAPRIPRGESRVAGSFFGLGR